MLKGPMQFASLGMGGLTKWPIGWIVPQVWGCFPKRPPSKSCELCVMDGEKTFGHGVSGL
jgi:hypothetical protein